MFTRKKTIILFSISLYWFIVGCAFAMIAPFFPGEASQKGASLSTVGMIFASYPLTIFFVSPIVGILIPIAGPKTVLLLGLIIEGGTQILFGFVDMMPDKETFVAFCFLIRIVSAIGGAATSTSALTIITQTFKDNLSPAVGIMETFGGFGMMAGPPIGGLLYSVGGFKLPFLAVGILALVSSIPIYFILPKDDTRTETSETDKGALWRALKIPAIIVVAVSIVVSGIALSFLDPTLQKHLQKPFHLNSFKVGLVFLIAPGLYAILAPLFGMIADKTDKRITMSLGAIVCGISYIALGPFPLIPSAILPRTLWMNCIALALLGLGVAPLFIPALADMGESAERYGMNKGLATKSALSSIFNSMFNIGAIAGPTVGSILVERLNFGWGAGIIGFCLALTGFVILVFTFFERRTRKYKESKKTDVDESRPILA
ncbi:MFS-type transporter SLC18B1-like [Rhopilema esculentum]|uniref:MFS-type transporter SLC18B1-like n=1 Tax=Rhopilema esculentum TaxID=499914 RepID=UPI0031D89906